MEVEGRKEMAENTFSSPLIHLSHGKQGNSRRGTSEHLCSSPEPGLQGGQRRSPVSSIPSRSPFPTPSTGVRLRWGKAQAPRNPGMALTLMLLLSMVSKSSGTILGTWLTRLIKKRPTVLSADTFPD